MNTAGTAKTSGRSLKGLELSEQYYRELVEPAIRESCPEALPHLAAGLVGEGSDCFGFDDGISKDHDWGPRVCLWLQDAAYERFFHVLSSTLASLPDTFRGERFALRTPEAAGRQGVLRTGEFYSSFTGSPEGPRSFRDWLSLPESHLAACTNGKVFYDGPGRFSMIRHNILNGCPEDVRRKRLAARIALMAQSGQYNYLRCIRHGETGAAQLACLNFAENAIHAAHLLEKRYMPYYKWAFRSLRGLGDFGAELADDLEGLITAGNDAETAESKYFVIEDIAARVIDRLMDDDLTQANCGDLEKHAYSVNDGVADGTLRNLHILSGV